MKKRSIALAMGVLSALFLTGCMPEKVDSEAEASAEQAEETGEAATDEEGSAQAESEAILTEITEPVEIEIWHQYSDQYEEWFQRVADDFMAENPNITIKLQYQPADQYEAKVMAAAKAGELPAMVHSAAANMTSYINEGFLVNMDDYIYDETVGIENFDEEINEGLNQMYIPWDNKRYAMPLFLGGDVFFYNKTMFDELGIVPPKTWSEVEAVATAVSEEIGKPGFGFQILVDGYMEVLNQAGGQVINLETNEIEFDSDIAKEKIAWYKDLIDKGVARLVGDDKHFTNPIANGDVGCFVGLSGNYGYLVGAVGDKFELGCAPLPQEGPEKFVSLSEPVFAIAETSPEEELASWLFLKYLLSPAVNAECSTIFGTMPVTASAAEEQVFKDFLESNAVAAAVYEQRDAYGYMPTVAGYYEVRTALDKALEEIMLGMSDVDTALSEAKETAQAAIDK